MWCLPANSGLHLATSLQPGLTRSNNAPSPGPLKPSAVRFLLCGTTCKSTQHSRSAQRAVSSRKGAGKVQETLQVKAVVSCWVAVLCCLYLAIREAAAPHSLTCCQTFSGCRETLIRACRVLIRHGISSATQIPDRHPQGQW